MSYRINEIFYSVQGEGVRAGTANVFVRFSGCNLECKRETEGFDCDTEFVSGTKMELNDLVAAIKDMGGACKNVIFTGGEPSLQLDQHLVDALKALGYYLAIETNGTNPLPSGLDWVCVSPKTAEHTIRVERCNEVKYVRCHGQGIPKPSIKADHFIISPAVQPDGNIRKEDLSWCMSMVMAYQTHQPWRFSVQQHKAWRVR